MVFVPAPSRRIRARCARTCWRTRRNARLPPISCAPTWCNWAVGLKTRGSATGALHRGWVAVKAKLSTYDDLAVLEECERGEDATLVSYRDALEHDLPAPIRNLIQLQYEGAKRNHVEIRNMRDSLRATARP